MLLQKGLTYNAEYASPDYPVLNADWTGSISLYKEFPGVAAFAKALTKTGNVFSLSLTLAEIIALDAGQYSAVTTLTNVPLGVVIETLEYVTVLDVNLSPGPMCKIFGTVIKPDGTPTGSPVKDLSNTVNGMIITTSWKGVSVTANISIADTVSGNVVGIERAAATTDMAGYFELYVIQGLTVNVSCPSLGKLISVPTTGLTEIDISTFF